MILTIRDIAADGRGIGPAEDGKIYFCDDALPGEKIEAEALKGNSCRPLRRLNDAPFRQDPPCPLFGRCGGCSLQHMQYEATLKLKHRQVCDKLIRIGGLSEESVKRADHSPGGKSCASPEIYHYRNNIRWHVKSEKGRVLCGFLAGGTHELLDIGALPCLLAAPPADKVRQHFQAFCQKEASEIELPHALQIRHSEENKELLITLFFRRSPFLKQQKKQKVLWLRWLDELKPVIAPYHAAGLCAVLEEAPRGRRKAKTEEIILSGRNYLHESIGGKEFFIQQGGFFQVNSRQAERLAETVFARSGALAGREIWDIYGGTGSLGLNFALAGLNVRVIEIHPATVKFGSMQAEANGVSERMQFYQGDASRKTAELLAEGFAPDIILTDPPRSGLTEKLIDDLASTGAERWIYVSCDPATLARDLHLMTEKGFCLESFETFDMFPLTMHVECLCVLSRRA